MIPAGDEFSGDGWCWAEDVIAGDGREKAAWNFLRWLCLIGNDYVWRWQCLIVDGYVFLEMSMFDYRWLCFLELGYVCLNWALFVWRRLCLLGEGYVCLEMAMFACGDGYVCLWRWLCLLAEKAMFACGDGYVCLRRRLCLLVEMDIISQEFLSLPSSYIQQGLDGVGNLNVENYILKMTSVAGGRQHHHLIKMQK
ncbi:hypothetical protein LAZ67_X003498 [Cordylochernes scorpioides]|uniref:Uncharacterized protein n=1 Tax=Cordylochernes scorpioides TaxID=51811 RepID=A0ABY6LUL7_9ARAC|nr:hypothetical protein LAZ67_X003498 [Cordylochernes scorpioides]